jgi:hypothetical protein
MNLRLCNAKNIVTHKGNLSRIVNGRITTGGKMENNRGPIGILNSVVQSSWTPECRFPLDPLCRYPSDPLCRYPSDPLCRYPSDQVCRYYLGQVCRYRCQSAYIELGKLTEQPVKCDYKDQTCIWDY